MIWYQPAIGQPAQKTAGQDKTAVSLTATPTLTREASAASALDIGASRIRKADGMRQLYVPAGMFEMGSNDGYRDESPAHSVYLDAYWFDETEVMNGQYRKCVAAGCCTKPKHVSSATRKNYYRASAYKNYPVIFVDWYQAQTYCEWAGGSLLTEAQWEKAARGTDGRTYP